MNCRDGRPPPGFWITMWPRILRCAICACQLTQFRAVWLGEGISVEASLRIAYEDDEGEWASLQPNFIIVSRRTDGTLGASIVDPHGDYLADARAKLQALAAFADRFSSRFVRVESVAKVEDGSLRVLDLADPSVRAEVLAFPGGNVTALYESEHSRPYV